MDFFINCNLLTYYIKLLPILSNLNAQRPEDPGMVPWGHIAETRTCARASPPLPVDPPSMGTGHHAVVRPRPGALLSKHKEETRGRTRDNVAGPLGQKSRAQKVTHGESRVCSRSETGSGAGPPGAGWGRGRQTKSRRWGTSSVLTSVAGLGTRGGDRASRA